MANKRQRLARKRFKTEHPEVFPKPEPTPPKDPDKKKKKKRPFKRKKTESNELGVTKKPFKKISKKHPLRVPGMKPGESCFICKGKDHIAKFCTKKAEWEKNKICLRCRERGHRAQNCPQVNDSTEDSKHCYNCGEIGHSLAKCPQPLQEGGTKFAVCFVCNEQGHLSKNCPKNTRGIYPKGGCCKICGGVTHLAKDCPDKGKKGPVSSNRRINSTFGTEEMPSAQVTKFVSGDDLEDDFGTDEISGADKDKSTKSQDSKRKKGPKVVNFS
ncbi:hypothetical protein L6164_006062 [Bauhinia variegata]|uniref:Uncharacterized protein n=1 Tax=Bauhinia variegata TaxID=167791 RepID=A0ACB9PVB3_BAUVA|nr:hypothetical protein L6164_006062 [Bauhinia variegata]